MTDRPPNRFYEFDMFRIDLEERQLLRNGRRVQLTPKIFDILLTLVENHGHTVGKNELMDRVWADAFVEEMCIRDRFRCHLSHRGSRFHSALCRRKPQRTYRLRCCCLSHCQLHCMVLREREPESSKPESPTLLARRNRRSVGLS